MNERLETEAVQFCIDKGYNLTPRQARELVKLGYSLALEDIKKKTEEMYESARKNSCDTWGVAMYALQDVLDFINYLTK